ncbi:MAG: L-threonylcarbamoyladenylate synthase [Pseudomonadota bacterium]
MIEPTIQHVHPADEASLAQAITLLKSGELVAFPTETVYGLGADARNGQAVAKIFAAKGRPSFNPLIVHFAEAESAAREVFFDGRAERLAAAYWPGPLTLVLPRRGASAISPLCSAGLDSLAVRVPGHPIGQRLLRDSGLALAAPSANASGRISPTSAYHVAQSLGSRVPLILDGGPAQVGLESSVVDLTSSKARLLRPGGIAVESIESVIGPLVGPQSSEGALENGEALLAPGLMASHYAPDLPVRLRATSVSATEALLAFGPEPLAGAALTINLSPSGNLTEAAARLFEALYALDQHDFAAIAAMPIPDHGLGQAINDRLTRAAAPRIAAQTDSEVLE